MSFPYFHLFSICLNLFLNDEISKLSYDMKNWLAYRRKTSKNPRFHLWTFPVLVDGPFGVVSAAELIGIILFVVFIIWAVYAYTLRNLSLLTLFDIPSTEKG